MQVWRLQVWGRANGGGGDGAAPPHSPRFFKAVQACFEVIRIPCLPPPPPPQTRFLKNRASVLFAVRSNKSHLKTIVFAKGGGVRPPPTPPLFSKPPKRASRPYESFGKLILRDCVCMWGGGNSRCAKRAFSSTNRSQNSFCEHRFANGGRGSGGPQTPPAF